MFTFCTSHKSYVCASLNLTAFHFFTSKRLPLPAPPEGSSSIGPPSSSSMSAIKPAETLVVNSSRSFQNRYVGTNLVCTTPSIVSNRVLHTSFLHGLTNSYVRRSYVRTCPGDARIAQQWLQARDNALSRFDIVMSVGQSVSNCFMNLGEGSDPVPAPPPSWIPPNESSYNTWPAAYNNLQTIQFCKTQFNTVSERIHCIETIGTGPILG